MGNIVVDIFIYRAQAKPVEELKSSGLANS